VRRGVVLTWLFAIVVLGALYMALVPQAVAAGELRKAQAEFRSAGIDASVAVMERDEVLERRDELAETVSSYTAVIDARKVFVVSAAKAQKALGAAEGKVDVTAHRKKAQAAQASAFAAKRDASIVLVQKEILDELTSKVAAAVSAHDKKVAEAAARKAASARDAARVPSRSSAPSADWLGDARRLLNSYGGSWVNLRSYDGNCGGSFHIGCNFSATDIGIHSAWASKGASYRNWVIMHELAHSYQRKNWSAIHASPTYKRLFNGEIELLANCMAKHRGQGWGGNRCTPERTAWAAGIWSGNVRG